MTTNQNSDSSQPRYSDEFNAEDAEVTYESSDGVRFRIHAVYLRAHTEVLAPIPGSTFDEVVHLDEPASILEILFKFIYPRRQPDLESSLEFEVIKDLAEAAEKYQVYPAMYASYLQMRAILPNHVTYVLAYALKHDYVVLVDEAAPLTLDEPTWDILQAIPAEYYEVWLNYHRQWQEVHTKALTTHLLACNPQLRRVSNVSKSLLALHQLDETFSGQDPDWKSLIKRDLDRIPKLTELISRNIAAQPVVDATVTPHGDVLVECGNEIQLRADTVTLKACAPGFVEGLSEDSTIRVMENSSTILRLLQFIRPTRSPDLGSLEFSELEELALAAEKYRVFQAMQMCKVFMKKTLPSHAENIFMYAAQSGYQDILDASGSLVLHLTFDDMAASLPPALLWPWARYYQRWQDVCSKAIEMVADRGFEIKSSDYYRNNVVGRCHCGVPFSTHMYPVTKKLVQGPKSLAELESLLCRENECYHLQDSDIHKQYWEAIQKDIRAIPPLSTFIHRNSN